MNQKIRKEKILVGLSGGIDSAAAALFLKEKGYQVSAVFFILNEKQRKALKKAEKIAEVLGVKLIRQDLSCQFKNKIVENFLDACGKNKTPNPCINCNAEIKFNFLEKLAQKYQFNWIATGHYARIYKEKNRLYLRKAKDKEKDQSYFLYRLKPSILEKVILPLGDCRKRDIIKRVKSSSFARLNFQRESQDLCFFSKKETLKKYLKKFFKENRGQILNESLEHLGWHSGLQFYTKGQRKGLNLPGGPFYVTKKDKRKNVLFVSRKKYHPDLKNDKILLKKVFWAQEEPGRGRDYQVKVRYAAKPIRAKLIKNNRGQWQANLIKPAWAVAEGQSLVVYDKEKVLGGGVIAKVK